MKFAAFSVIAISILSVAAAVTVTFYSDAACATAVPTSTADPNPFVTALNACTKYMTIPVVGSIYIKATACATGGKIVSQSYTDDKCTVKSGAEQTTDEGKCNPGNGASSKTTCDPASSVTLASIAVAAAVLAFCM